MRMKSVALSVAALLASFAGAEALSFLGATDRNPLLYACGEEMTFTVTLVDREAGNAPVKGRRLVWTRQGDDGKKEGGEARSDEPLVVKTRLAKPGFVRLTVNVLDEDGKKVREAKAGRDVCWDGGAGADVNRIEAWPPPGDLDAFWDARLAELARTPCKATLTELIKNLSAWERKLIEGPYIHHMAEIEGDYTEELREFTKYVKNVTLDTVQE